MTIVEVVFVLLLPVSDLSANDHSDPNENRRTDHNCVLYALEITEV